MLNLPRRNVIRLLALLAMLVASRGHAQGLSADAMAPQQAKARRFLMWKVSSPTTTVYLVGSIHVGDKNIYPLPEAVESAFAASRVLVVEVNTKDLDQSKALQLMQQYGLYGPDDALSHHLSKETSDALDDFCNKHGLPRAGLERVKPWAVAVAVIALVLQQAGEDPKLGIDMHFLNEAKPTQRIAELETPESQLSLFASATEQEQQELLASALKQADRAKELLQKIQEAYLAGEADKLQKLIEEQNTGPKSLMKKVLDDRNVSMAEKVESYLKGKEPCFVVVGAAHIVGDKGVVKLLQDKGYRVEQVTWDSK